MPPKKGKKIVIKPKVLENIGYLMTADSKQLVIAVDYKFKALAFGEIEEWSGTFAIILPVPMDIEYLLCLDPEEDDRSGRIRIESVKESKKGQFTTYKYTFKGVTPLT